MPHLRPILQPWRIFRNRGPYKFWSARLDQLWLLVSEFGKNVVQEGGKKINARGKDILMMLLTTVKHGGHWYVLGRVFNISGPTFERMILQFARLVLDHVYSLFIADFSKYISLHELHNKSSRFQTFLRLCMLWMLCFNKVFVQAVQLIKENFIFLGSKSCMVLK